MRICRGPASSDALLMALLGSASGRLTICLARGRGCFCEVPSVCPRSLRLRKNRNCGLSVSLVFQSPAQGWHRVGSEVVPMDIGHPGKGSPLLLSKLREAQRSGLKSLCGDSPYPDGLTNTLSLHYTAGEVPQLPKYARMTKSDNSYICPSLPLSF